MLNEHLTDRQIPPIINAYRLNFVQKLWDRWTLIWNKFNSTHRIIEIINNSTQQDERFEYTTMCFDEQQQQQKHSIVMHWMNEKKKHR